VVKEYQRSDRLAELIQTELAMLLNRNIADPRLRGLSITAVKVSPDLGHARVHFSMLNPDKTKIKQAEQAFRKAQGFIRKHIAQAIELRLVPTFSFYFDELADKSLRLLSIIDAAVQQDVSH